MANLDQIIEHVAGDCKVEINENPSITSTTGVVNSARIIRYGRVCFFEISVKNNSSVATGSNIYVGTLNDTNYIPYLNFARSSDYTGGQACLFNLSSSGQIVCRNASTTAVSAGDSLRGCFVYFLDELGGVIKKFLFPHILCERGCAA